MVLAALLGQVDGFQADIAQFGPFVGQPLRLDGGHCLERFVVVNEVDVAAQFAAQLWQIGHHVAQFAQVDMLHTQRNIVGCGVGLAVEGEGRAVVCHQVNVGRNGAVAA